MNRTLLRRCFYNVCSAGAYFLTILLLAFGIATLMPCTSEADDSDSTYVQDSLNSDLGSPPGSYRILSEDGVISFPFELFRGDILVHGEINGHPVRMLIDNGIMSWDQILFFGSPLDDSLGFNFDGEIDVGGAGEGDQVPARTASGVTIRFPGVEFTDQTAIVMPYRGVPNPWIVEGQVCGTFFKHFAVKFDFDKMIITLTPQKDFIYDGNGQEIPIKHFGGGLWGFAADLELADGRSISLDVSMDLGFGDQFEISTTGENRIAPPPDAIPGSLGFGIQGETLGHFGRINSIRIGRYQLDNVVAGFIDPEYKGSTFGEVLVGLGLLSRFNFTYDYPHRRMFLEPNHTFERPFEYNMSGLWVGRLEGDHLNIRAVVPDSPAAEAGITAEDKIVRINGRLVREVADPWVLEPMLQRAGETVTLTLLRDGKTVDVSIKLRRLI
jgi:hypothetical protein